jgi:uncharacterized protein YprB with RNaseH-like and TPR domain
VRVVRTIVPAGTWHGSRRLDELIERWDPSLAAELGGFAEPPERAEELVFFDAETTGLGVGAGTRAFQLGLARLLPDGAVEMEQFWLAEARQEPALIASVVERLAGSGAWVSFNGKSFDAPLLESRSVLTGHDWPRRPHLDLLHPARRLLSRGLPNARLGSVERDVLGFQRVDDVDGSEAPAAWFAWLRHGDSEGIEAVLRHNAWDLLSLLTLLAALLELVEGGAGPGRVRHDALALAEHQARAGRGEEARRALTAAGPASGGEARRGLRQARLVKRLEGASAAVESWRSLLASAEAGPEPYEELAKVLEHRQGDPAAAREVVLAALERFGRRGRVRERLRHRLARLDRKCGEQPVQRLGPPDGNGLLRLGLSE